MDTSGYLERFRLDGRTALITGASRNIGAAIAGAFAAAGANLVVNARTGPALDAFAAGVRERFGVDPIAETTERVAAYPASASLTPENQPPLSHTNERTNRDREMQTT